MTEQMKSSNRPEKPCPVSEMPLGLPAPTERAGSICASNIRVQSTSLAAWHGLHLSTHSFSTKKDVLTTTTPRALSWSLAHTHLTDPAAQGVGTIYYSLHGLDKKTELRSSILLKKQNKNIHPAYLQLVQRCTTIVSERGDKRWQSRRGKCPSGPRLRVGTTETGGQRNVAEILTTGSKTEQTPRPSTS